MSNVILVVPEDFIGFHQLAQSEADAVELQAYIDRFESISIKKILGDELGKLFIDDITGEDSDSSEITERFQKILDSWTEQEQSGSFRLRCEPKIWESLGIKDALLAIIYYNFVFRTGAKHTQAGVTLAQAETSGVFSPENQGKFAEMKFNDSLETIWAIQWLCKTFDPDTYPEYKGLRFKVKYSALL